MELLRAPGIYRVTNKTNGKTLIGQTQNIKKRRYGHWYLLAKGAHPNPHLQHAWNKYGEEAFTFEAVVYAERSELDRLEVALIAAVPKDLSYNILPGGYGQQRGKAVSAETRAKLSLAAKGRKYPPEYGRRISAAKKGKSNGPHSAETRAKIGDAHRGRRASEEEKAARRLRRASPK